LDKVGITRADRKCGEYGNQYVKVAMSNASTLAKVGITRNESSHLQKIAAIPECTM